MQTIELDITDLSHDGRGVGRHQGKTVFVSGALPDERVRATLRRRRRRFDEASTEAVLSASADRVEPSCMHFGRCGGCALQHLDNGAQIRAKQRVLAENFERIGKVVPQQWAPPLRDSSWGYRRKGRLSVRYVEKKGRVLVGFRERNPRFVADIERCEVAHPALGPHVGELARMLDTLDAKRAIAQIEFAAGDDTVALVVRHLEPLSEADRARLDDFARARNYVIYLQPGGVDSVHPLKPDAPPLRFRIPAADVEIRFEPLDFVQINAGLNLRMIDQVIDWLQAEPRDRVLDLFSGLGNFSLPIARRVASVAAVEGNAALVERAGENARRNDIDNVECHVADLAAEQSGAAWARADWDKLLLDPPRVGAEAVLRYLPSAATRRIVYVSCHPGSLARDAGVLVHEHGFQLSRAGVMDMFPHTAHVESIALFERA